jgi:homocysteine S-methyltransferase
MLGAFVDAEPSVGLAEKVHLLGVPRLRGVEKINAVLETYPKGIAGFKRYTELLDTEPDMLAIETMPDLDEVRMIMELVESKKPEIDFWVSFTVREAGQLSGGATFAEACAVVERHSSAIAIGINCSPLSVITPTLTSVETDLPFVVYPNAGQSWDSESMSWAGKPEFATHVNSEEWVSAGARIIGGCCGYGTSQIPLPTSLFDK